MNGTLFSTGMLDGPLGFVVAALVGILFGFFLEQAGFGSSRKLTGIFYFRDMAVLKVMFTAVVVAMVGLRLLEVFGVPGPDAIYIPDTYWFPQLIGGLVFGIGFVMGGWCPGTAFAGLAAGKLDAVVFLVGTIAGSILFNELFPWIKALYEAGYAGPVLVADLVPVSSRVLTLAVCVAAVCAFSVAGMLERRIGGKPAPTGATRTRRALAAVALLVAAAGLFALPEPAEANRSAALLRPPARETVLAEVVREIDHIEPGDLADRLLAGKAPLLVDIRGPEAYAAFRLPGAVNLPLAELAERARGVIPTEGEVVLYSNGTTHAAQAWMYLRQQGYTNVRILTDGLVGFFEDCMTPPSLSRPGADEVAAAALFGRYDRLQRLLTEGSVPAPSPEAVPPPPPKPDAPEAPTPPPDVPELAVAGLEGHVVSVEWLAAKLDDPTVRVLDVRGEGKAYTAGHVPGALYLHPESLRGTVDGIPARLLPPDAVAAQLGRLGITPDMTLVVVGDALRDETLVALALASVGHNSFAVLHGGYGAWTARELPRTKEIPPVKATAYAPRAGADGFVIGKEELAAAVRNGAVRVVDVRPADYFTGAKSDEARPGHIPGAVNRPFEEDLVPGRQAWRDRDALLAAYAALGAQGDEPVVVSCRTGHQASQTFFLLKHVLGLGNVRWYDGSWSEWAADPALPAEK